MDDKYGHWKQRRLDMIKAGRIWGVYQGEWLMQSYGTKAHANRRAKSLNDWCEPDVRYEVRQVTEEK